MKIDKIFLDIDNVVADWTSFAAKTAGLDFDDLSVRLPFESQETISGLLNENSLWKQIGDRGEMWWRQIPLLPWAIDLWTLCNRHASTIFLSSPFPGCDVSIDVVASAASGKIKWINQHFLTRKIMYLGFNIWDA